MTKDYWLEHGWRTQPIAEERLYDVVFDPHETNNLADDPNWAEVLNEMRERLAAWMQETGDPLPDNPVIAHEDGVVNNPDDLHPQDQQYSAREYLNL